MNTNLGPPPPDEAFRREIFAALVAAQDRAGSVHEAKSARRAARASQSGPVSGTLIDSTPTITFSPFSVR